MIKKPVVYADGYALIPDEPESVGIEVMSNPSNALGIFGSPHAAEAFKKALDSKARLRIVPVRIIENSSWLSKRIMKTFREET